jgi:hypothetical protein
MHVLKSAMTYLAVARVNQHLPEHYEGWMVKWSGNNFLLGSNSLTKPWWLANPIVVCVILLIHLVRLFLDLEC